MIDLTPDLATNGVDRSAASPEASGSAQITALRLAELYRHVDVASRLGATDYAIALCGVALDAFPNDLRARGALGQVCLEAGNLDQARQQFELVLELDPEDAGALATIGVIHSAQGHLDGARRAFERAYELQPGDLEIRDSLLRLRAEREPTSPEVPVAPAVAVIRWQLGHDDLDDALQAANRYLIGHPGDLAILVARVEALWRGGRGPDAERACRQILARYPRCLKPRLILGQVLAAEPARRFEGLEILHGAFADDPSGKLANRLFADSGYRLPVLAEDVSLAIPHTLAEPPAGVIAALETIAPDRIGEETAPPWSPPEPAPEGTDRPDAIGPGDSAPSEESRDVATCLLAISCRQPLVRGYGIDGFQRIERRLQTVARELGDVGTLMRVVFLDDEAAMAQFGGQPIEDRESATIKAALDGLVASIRRDPRWVDSAPGSPDVGVLIVGGDDVVPFFRLANPADDDEATILSDNPYGVVAGDSVLTPSLPVGRLLDGAQGNAAALLRQIDTILSARRARPGVPGPGGIARAGRSALEVVGLGRGTGSSFALCAASWRGVAEQVIAGITPGSSARPSPPAVASEFDARWLAGRRYLSFALNGAPTSVAWYGELLPDDSDELVVPVALTPDVLTAEELNAPAIFSSAGYGAGTAGKSASGPLALRFLAEGAAGFVGSTASCYGAVDLPLAGADLLGHLFWREVRRGRRLGDALARARRAYVALEGGRQGFLDGDDQKTLLSFVLYGDPLLALEPPDEGAEAEAPAPGEGPALLCHRAPVAPVLDHRLRRQGVERLLDYCPELADGAVRTLLRRSCRGDCDLPGHRASPIGVEAVQVTARKEVVAADATRLVKLARLTLSPSGEALKVLVTR